MFGPHEEPPVTLPCRFGVHERCAGSFRSPPYSHLLYVLEDCNCRCHIGRGKPRP